MSIFFFDVTTLLYRIQFYYEMKLNFPPIDQYLIKMIIEAFYPSPDLQTCLTTARLRHRKGSDFSGKCQTQLTNLLQTKVEIWVATNWCFLGIFIQFYQVPDVSGKCQTKGFRLVWQMPDSSEYFFWPAYMCQTQLKKLGGNKMIF